jgi:transcriptional regulator with XRE-family HTH domain
MAATQRPAAHDCPEIHLSHRLPEAPHALVAVPAWHTPAAVQQPTQVLESHAGVLDPHPVLTPIANSPTTNIPVHDALIRFSCAGSRERFRDDLYLSGIYVEGPYRHVKCCVAVNAFAMGAVMVRADARSLAKTIGDRARGFRLSLGATQERAAEWIGLSSQVYARLERGEMLPSVPTLVRMASAYSVNVGDFFPSTDGSRPEAVAVARSGSRRSRSLNVEGFDKLDAPSQAIVHALVRQLGRRASR